MATPTKTTKAPKKAKAQAAAVPVPQGPEQCQSQITQLGNLIRRHAVMKAELDGKVAALVEIYAATLAGLATEASALQQGIQIWCEANRDAITQGRKVKTANLVTGEVSWRQNPPSVTVRKADEVLAKLRELGLVDYIRKTEEVNKESILALDSAVEKITVETLAAQDEPAQEAARQKLHLELLRGVPGLSIVKGLEVFSVTPFETTAATPGAPTPAPAAATA